ncbi:MAG: DUF1778 domain-containing protein [Propionibacteriaceae bacterium]|jgi:uncharacterized protein (DUF1778 family)|nr:DUF1778 domain-containing protein [Propionibacteriaceae bacterium]
MSQLLRSRRFETRLDQTTDDLIARAAKIRGESRSAFVVRAAREAAEKVVSPVMTKQEALAVLLDGLDESQLAHCPLVSSLRQTS